MRKALRNLTLTLAGALMMVPFAQGAVTPRKAKKVSQESKKMSGMNWSCCPGLAYLTIWNFR